MSYDLKKILNTDNKLIDLRSDTVTKPSPAMRKAMADAEVGDDVYGEDPTVNKLEKIVAEKLGKEAAIFMSSGTQSNLSALLSHCARGEEIIVGKDYHVFIDEAAGASVLGGIALYPIDVEEDKSLSPEKISAAVKPDDPHCPISKLLCLENTVWGQVIPLEKMYNAKFAADKHGLSIHLDGARFYNAISQLKCSEIDLAKCADTVSVCLSKGLGAPVGTILALPNDLAKKARRWRKMLGGSMRQSGVLAAAGIYALENNVERFTEDRQKALYFNSRISKFCSENQDEAKIHSDSNMVFFTPNSQKRENLSKFMFKKGIIIEEPKPSVRLVFHLDISDNNLNYIVKAFEEYLD